MLIVCEGPDGGGKTTFCAELAAAWPGPSAVHHFGPPDPPDRCIYEEYEVALDTSPLVAQIRSSDFLVIFDRFHLGDRIYGPQYRGFSRWTEAGLLHGEMVLSSAGAVKVMCLPPLSVVQARVTTRGDDYVRIDDMPRIYREYQHHAHAYRYVIPTWDIISSFNTQSVLARAPGRVAAARELAVASAGTYTGSLSPAVIFAGDELGGSEELGTRLGFQRPFTPKLPGSCSEWLLSAMLAGGIVNNAGLVNVNHPGVSARQLAELRPGARWVALGQKAAATLEKAGVPHWVEQHPQYARRFRHDDLAGYTAELLAAAGQQAGSEQEMTEEALL